MKFIVILLVAISFESMAQDWTNLPVQDPKSPNELKLNVGDRIPFTEFHNVINYPTATMRIAEQKSKLMILDFWSTSCGPCIRFWPTAMKLQKEFGQDLQIIQVNNYENSRQVKAFIAKRKRIDGFEMNLPTVCRDSTIWKNFPAGTLPRYVWVSDGIVRAITSTNDVNSDNIRQWLSVGPLKLLNHEEKKFHRVNPSVPLFLNGNGGERSADVFLFTSSLTKGQDDIPANSSIRYDSASGYSITATNSPIIILYGLAYNNRLRDFDYFDFLTFSRMQLIVKDSSRYWDDGTLGGNTFSYQFISKQPKTRQQLIEIMQQDLRRYIGLDVNWEKQMKKCLVFTMFDAKLATKKQGIAAEAQMRDGKIILDSVTVKDVMTVMEMGTDYYRTARYPLIDETNYTGIITGIREESARMDPMTMDAILSKVGIHFRFEMREVDILTLKEPGIN